MRGRANSKIALREEGGAPQRCPLCFEATGDWTPGNLERCLDCWTSYHRDCLAELGGCSTLGCAGARPRSPKEVVAPSGRAQSEQEAGGDSGEVARALKLFFAAALGLCTVLLFLRAGQGLGSSFAIGAGSAGFVALLLLNPVREKLGY